MPPTPKKKGMPIISVGAKFQKDIYELVGEKGRSIVDVGQEALRTMARSFLFDFWVGLVNMTALPVDLR